VNSFRNFAIFLRKRSQFALVLGTGVFLFFGLVSEAGAITISPPRLELAADPGATVTGKFEVTNDTQSDTVYYTQVENFEAGDESGNPQFVTTKEGLATWVDVPRTISVRAGELRTVPFSITVPRSAEPGGYFASIFVRTTPPPENGGEVSIGARLGTLLLLRVNGEIQEGVSILEFATKDNQRVFTALPVELYYRFQNTGADRVKPEGSIVIKNLFGLTAKSLDANRPDGSVLPRSIRRFESAWITSGGGEEDPATPAPTETIDGFFAQAKNQVSNFALGYYSANLDIRFGENNNTATGVYRFLVIPWQLLSIVVVGLILLWLILRTLLRAYTRRVIRQHQAPMKR
jgi:hypothetical protein